MLLIRVAETSSEVAATPARLGKIGLLARLVGELSPAEAPIAVAYLAGDLPQGRIGVGWAALRDLDAPPAAQPTLRLRDVDAAFSQIDATSGPGSQQVRMRLLHGLFAAATAAEQEFLRQLLSGNLRQGALEGVMVEALARAGGIPPPAVRRAVMLSGDLGTVAEAVVGEGRAGLRRFGLTLFNPVKPMLAQTADDVAAAHAKLGGGDALWEWKLDGARVQVHRAGADVAVYTRSLKDITGSVPDVVAAARSLPVTQVILDGEAIGLAGDGRPLPFQQTMTRFGGEGGRLATAFFDVLHLDGDDLIDEPARDRLPALDRAVPAALRIPRLVTAGAAAAEAFFQQALAGGHEGVMAKSLDAAYEAGRRGAAWVKVKQSHTLDLVVIAVEWGSGRREGWLSNVHLGARDPASGEFVMLGKTFKGMTDEMLEWQTQRFLGLETHRRGHVVHVRPEQVVEIAFDGIQRSSRYPGGMALRFARVKGYRQDKTATEADTIDTVRTIFEAARGAPRGS